MIKNPKPPGEEVLRLSSGLHVILSEVATEELEEQPPLEKETVEVGQILESR